LPSSSAARDPSRVSGANAAIHGAAKRRRPFRRGRHSRRRRPLVTARSARNGRHLPGPASLTLGKGGLTACTRNGSLAIARCTGPPFGGNGRSRGKGLRRFAAQ
jgi:hypothetical protein